MDDGASDGEALGVAEGALDMGQHSPKTLQLLSGMTSSRNGLPGYRQFQQAQHSKQLQEFAPIERPANSSQARSPRQELSPMVVLKLRLFFLMSRQAP